MTEPDTHRELLITLVHGTWGRGFLPWLRVSKTPFWFEGGSSFRKNLSTALNQQNISHQISPYLWSGANSIFSRDAAALELAASLAAEKSAKPGAAQMIIAHSHGGNIAVRAAHHLRNLTGSRPVTPLIVTMGTPFIQVHPQNATSLRLTLQDLRLLMVLVAASQFVTLAIAMPELLALICACLIILLCCLAIRFIRDRQARSDGRLQELTHATQLTGANVEERMLVIRAIDDEASLALAAGAILNRLVPRLFQITSIVLFLSMLFAVIVYDKSDISVWLITGLFAFITIMLIVGRAVYGREMALAPLDCQINTQSSPDGDKVSRLVRLVSTGVDKRLRHGIYDHEDCVRTIADWVWASHSGCPRSP